MSIDIFWPTLTSGPDGDRLASQIRDSIHDKFQAIALPRFIQSVQVHSFDFGSVAPDVELKDIGDPLGDFYEGGGEDDEEDESGNEDDGWGRRRRDHVGVGGEEDHMSSSRSTIRATGLADSLAGSATAATDTSTSVSTSTSTSVPQLFPTRQPPAYNDTSFRPPTLRTTATSTSDPPPFSPFLGRSPTPIVPGGTSTLNHYFHSPLTTGLSGTQTPLAAVAGAHLPSGWLEHTSSANIEGGGGMVPQRQDSAASVESLSPPSTANSSSAITQNEESTASAPIPPPVSPPHSPSTRHRRRQRLPRPSDFQVMARVRYSGDIALSLTAMILLDYPMPSFVGIPIKLNITGLSFDGVAVLAFVRRKNLHFCFLTPEDAAGMGVGGAEGKGVGGGLLREIKVESEIGQREGGKQSLKNVGKVEKFVLEQVRRIFEEEFVYPSFWTFLV